MKEKFNSLKLRPELLKNLKELEFTSMTPIQSQALPIILEGKDILAQAKTGSGKTAAFGLSILNDLDITHLNVKSLVLCPTRELAEQVAKEIRMLARSISNIRVLTVCGGVAEMHQEKSLSYGAHIVVGTPGRVLKFLQKDYLNLKMMDHFILDEADKMLDMGFHDDIMKIKSFLPKERQSMLFSATFPEEIENLSKKILFEPKVVKVDIDHDSNSINQLFYELEKHQEKNQAVLKILNEYRPERTLVFCKTKVITDGVVNFLNSSKVVAAGIHGDIEQNERTSILTKFSNKSLSVLVATDVAARGLDITDLDAVINFDIPNDPTVYIHRIGRTGRAGKTGHAFGLFVEKELYKLEAIRKLNKAKCQKGDISSLTLDDDFNLIPPMKTMYVGGGKKNKLRPGDLLGALVGEAKLDPSDVGNISIFNIVSYVAIKKDKADQAVDKLRSGKIKNKKFKVGLA